MVGLAVYLGSAAYHNPGAWAACILVPSGLALLPLLLSACFVHVTSWLSRPASQAKAGNGAALGSTTPWRPTPPPSGYKPSSTCIGSSSAHLQLVSRSAAVLLAGELTPVRRERLSEL